MGTHPPFRAEHIGSLLRPAGLLALRQKFNRGEVDRQELAAAENRAIEEAVALQGRLGFKLATDGEFRRRSYHSYFYAQLGDVAPDSVMSDAGDLRTYELTPATTVRFTEPELNREVSRYMQLIATSRAKDVRPGEHKENPGFSKTAERIARGYTRRMR